MVVLLHKCGRSAGDFWPYSSQGCSTCQGLPNSVAKTKQALARGYAVVAVSSRDRSREGRCFGMEADAPAVVEVISTFPAKLGLPAGAPVYVDGASSGGSLALRLPRLVKFSGVIGEVIGPPNFGKELELLDQSGLGPMPPTLYIHMPHDEDMAAKVAENIALLRARGTPVAEIQVFPRPVTPAYFAGCSPYISDSLAALLHTRLKDGGLLDSTDMLAVDLKDARWGAFRSYTNGPMEADLAGMPDQGIKFAPLLSLHIFDCLGVAWARHETIGEYMTAALVWLENGGKVDVGEVAARFRVPR
ncbi:hypothetical protein C2E21_5329 [Chlorella sorokiniana]|uniref:Uncharacterized protein n=1 Tax=Chlorella sorokiniana TaxID=3076 RepID=A0A2P6TNM6_CHLSO|nr:hypothetical protein C2E21_5329 [Chlorella sorokiniana]|eukprot:PRW50941.1 hypothetical protein C2E21_5329 [Chlorella sorokiniana]